MKVDISEYKDDNEPRDINIRIDDCDCWNLDTTLALVIGAALSKFKERTLNLEVISGVPADFVFMDESGQHEVKSEEWVASLEEMIWAFEQIGNNEKDCPYDADNGYKEYKNYHLKIQKGIDLFAKYYRNLWE